MIRIDEETRARDLSASEVVETFLHRMGTGDLDRLEELLAPDVWLRALLVRDVHEATTAGMAVEAFTSWVGGENGRRMLEAEHGTMAGRQFLRYRFAVRPAWAPNRWHVIEQAGFCRVQDGRITRMDLACTGYFPVEEGMEEVPADLLSDGLDERRSA